MTIEDYPDPYSGHGTLTMSGHPSGYTGGHFNARYSKSPLWTIEADGGLRLEVIWEFWSDRDSHQTGQYYFTDLSDRGYFKVYYRR